MLLSAPVWSAESEAMRLDGRFDDWADIIAVAAPSSAALIRATRITNDEHYLFIAVELQHEVVLQQENPLLLLADTDGDASTGLQIDSLGADVQYDFGELAAFRHVAAQRQSVSHTELGIMWAPTFSSNRYEIALPLSLFGNPEPGEEIAVAVAELPDVQSTASVVRYRTTVPTGAIPEIALARSSPPHVRILTMNVLNDGLFEKPEVYARILGALDPDILLLSEVFDHSADQVIALLDEYFPAKNSNQRWYGVGHPGKVTISKYPFLETDVFLEDLYTLIDAPGFDDGLFVVHTHLECCDRDDMRQEKVDGILAKLDEQRDNAGSILGLLPEHPLVFSGDLNLVGSRRIHDTLVDGLNDLISAASSKKLVEAVSHHTNTPFTFTWKDDTLKWPPGKLDFTFYTVPDLVLGKSFVLYTPNMSAETLKKFGLQASDSIDASDHLPHVVDVAPGPPGD